MAEANLFIYAADNNAKLLPLLRANPELALSQDENGFSLVHAAASWNHALLVRTLVTEFSVPVDILDTDQESALFQTETVEIARILVEELGASTTLQNEEGMTPADKLESEGEYPLVAAYLRSLEGNGSGVSEAAGEEPKLPADMKVTFNSADEIADGDLPIDEEFRRKIEELASMGDFEGEGQKKLRELVEEAIRGRVSEPEQDGDEQKRKKA